MSDSRLQTWPVIIRPEYAFLFETADDSAVIGNTILDNTSLSIGDMERRSGLYILGKPRTGKSWLLVNLILQDIEHKHGVFFIDPHGDAINDIIARCSMEAINNRCLLLDPEIDAFSFGINLLECQNIENMKDRADTFTKAKGVFDKLWKKTFEDKPWLQMILQNTLYALIENQGYTLADLPLFFRDHEFRDYIIGNIQYNWQVKNYWLQTFAAKSKHDQNEQMEAAETRAAIMLAHSYVNDIVGQAKTTVKFAKLIEEKRIVLIRLSANLSYEAKKIIGTILISELLHAIEHRPRNKRDQFCIFVDEFQTFAAFEDFSTLITQAPKYGIATTIAHHERYGQLGRTPEVLGATAAIANKVLFQVTARDADELAAEFAEAPPTETRREQEFVISQNPLFDLMRGHENSQICRFVDQYLRPLQERLQDMKDDMQEERLTRTDVLDKAAMLRLQEKADWLDQRGRGTEAILAKEGGLIELARDKTGKMQNILEATRQLRESIRDMNRFLTAIMEGKIAPGQEPFYEFFKSLAKNRRNIGDYARTLDLYMALMYGDANAPRIVPVRLAEECGLFASEVAKVKAILKAKAEWESKTVPYNEIYEEIGYRYKFEEFLMDTAGISGKKYYDVLRDSKDILLVRANWDYLWSEETLYIDFGIYDQCRPLQSLLAPYLHKRFEPEKSSKKIEVVIPDTESISKLLLWRGLLHAPKLNMWQILDFLHKYREGAFVVLSLIEVARFAYPKMKHCQAKGWDYKNPYYRVGHAPEIMDANGHIDRGVYDVIHKLMKIIDQIPDYGEPHRLNYDEREKLKAACLDEISESEEAKKALRIIKGFADFCMLLARVENRVWVPSGQYSEKRVNIRSEQDMVSEVARELVGLPKYTAYAKVLHEENGIQKVRKGKIETRKLDEVPEGENGQREADRRHRAIWFRSWPYYMGRKEIEAEMRERQEAWRGKAAGEPPSAQSGGEKGPETPSVSSVAGSDEQPPPSHL